MVNLKWPNYVSTNRKRKKKLEKNSTGSLRLKRLYLGQNLEFNMHTHFQLFGYVYAVYYKVITVC